VSVAAAQQVTRFLAVPKGAFWALILSVAAVREDMHIRGANHPHKVTLAPSDSARLRL
jgi:hypothetical protein